MNTPPGVVTEQKYRDLLERGGLIADTAGTAGWAELVRFIDEKRGELESQILKGNCKTHDAYIAAVEWCHGVDYVLQAPQMFDAMIREYKQALANQAEDEGAE